MEKRQAVLDALKELEIPCELSEHPAVYTIEDMEELGITELGEVCKNLFLRDAKGKTHFLVVLMGQKRADLESIARQLGSTKLSFASEQRLLTYLGLEKGAVTPLGVINDKHRDTIVVFDQDLRGIKRVGVHPNENTATVWMAFESLERFVSCFGNEVRYISI